MAKIEHGWSIAPNQSSTKASWILANTPGLEGRDLCVGTIDSWIAWTLSEGALHVSDQTNASATTNGLRLVDGSAWNAEICDAFGVDQALLPTVVDSVGMSAPPPHCRGAADRGDARRSTGVARRAELRASGPGEDHLRHRGHARSVHRLVPRPRERTATRRAPIRCRCGPSTATSPGASRRSCSRRAPTSTGCETISV
jgi:hypothetical protein